MSVKHSILALLEKRPAYGYQLRGEFEERTAETWPLNIGQVYTTLERLDRDGLVRLEGEDADGKKMYSITEPGRAELHDWFDEPLAWKNPPRDELALKISLAASSETTNVFDVIQTQRASALRTLHSHIQNKRTHGEPTTSQELGSALVRESLIFTLEAQIRWLDHCESVIRATR